MDFSNDFVKNIKSRLKKMPISAVSKEKGSVTVVQYKDSNLIVPVVKKLMNEGIYCSTCILVKTNEEALQWRLSK